MFSVLLVFGCVFISKFKHPNGAVIRKATKISVIVTDFCHGSTHLDFFIIIIWRCMFTMYDLVGIACLLQQEENCLLVCISTPRHHLQKPC